MNINKFIDKKYEKLTLKELTAAPVDAIAGISAGDAKLLKEAFKVKPFQTLQSCHILIGQRQSARLLKGNCK